MKVVVPTCQRYMWAINPFQYLFNQYWSSLQPVVVGGFSLPTFPLPPNFEFYQIAPDDYPASKWTDGVIALLNHVQEDIVTFLLDDYWLCRGVNHQAVNSLVDYMRKHPDILRIDLTNDRLFSTRAADVDTWGYIDLIECPRDTPYQWSTQACLVNRKHFLSCLRPGMEPWQFELKGNELIPDGLRVLGTRQYPVRYVNAIGMGCETKYRTEHEREGIWGMTIEKIDGVHIQHMLENGILPPNE